METVVSFTRIQEPPSAGLAGRWRWVCGWMTVPQLTHRCLAVGRGGCAAPSPTPLLSTEDTPLPAECPGHPESWHPLGRVDPLDTFMAARGWELRTPDRPAAQGQTQGHPEGCLSAQQKPGPLGCSPTVRCPRWGPPSRHRGPVTSTLSVLSTVVLTSWQSTRMGTCPTTCVRMSRRWTAWRQPWPAMVRAPPPSCPPWGKLLWESEP